MSTEPQTDTPAASDGPTAPTDAAPKRGMIGRARHGVSWLKANKKRFFWWWIAYQAVKGITTLSLIWIPLLLVYLRSRGEGG